MRFRYTQAIAEMSKHLQAFCESTVGTTFLDAGNVFVAKDGSKLLQDMMPDALHPSALGEKAMDDIRAKFIADLLRSHA
jgi:lysophospholipase L1-like esterase